MLTAVVIVVLVAKPTHTGSLALAAHLAEGVTVALALDVAFLVAFRRTLVPETLRTPILIALVLTAYAVPNLFMHEAGLIGATVFGIVLANRHRPGLGELRRHKEAPVVLLVDGEMDDACRRDVAD